MRLSALAAALVLIAVFAAPGQDFKEFVRRTDRGDNLLVLQLLRSADLGTALAAAEGLGERADPYVADILEPILAEGAAGAQPQLVLRTVLAGVFAQSRKDLSARLRENHDGLSSLASGLPELSPPLQRELLRVLALYPPAADRGRLMALGMGLAEQAQRQEGRLTGEQSALVVDYLAAVSALGDRDFAPVALLILEGTREPAVSRAARRVARQFLSAGP